MIQLKDFVAYDALTFYYYSFRKIKIDINKFCISSTKLYC